MTKLAPNTLKLLIVYVLYVSFAHGIQKQFISVSHATINTTVTKTSSGNLEKIVTHSDLEPLVLVCSYTSVLFNGAIQKLSTNTSFREIYWRYVAETDVRIIENGTQGVTIYTDSVDNVDQITTKLLISSNLAARPNWLENKDSNKKSKFFIGELAGKYQCIFETFDYGFVQEIAEISMEPIIRKMNIEEVVSGDNALLKCDVYGYPRPTRFKWLKQSGVNFTEIIGASNKTLLIRKTTQEDRVNYKCQVEVMSGGKILKDDQTLFLRVKDRYAALWPCIGILIEILIMAVITFLSARRDKAHENKIKKELDKTPTDN